MSRFILAVRVAVEIPEDPRPTSEGIRTDQAEANRILLGMTSWASSGEILGAVAIDTESGLHDRETEDLRDDHDRFIIKDLQERLDKREKDLGRIIGQRDDLKEALAEATLAKMRAIWSQQHTRDWWSTRMHALRDLAKATGIWDKVACIIANGQPTIQADTPNYTRDLVGLKYRLELAEKERDQAIAELLKCRESVIPALEGFHGHRSRPVEDLPWWEDAGKAIKFLRICHETLMNTSSRPPRSIAIDLYAIEKRLKKMPSRSWVSAEVPPRQGKHRVGFAVKSPDGQPIANVLSTTNLSDEIKEAIAEFIAHTPTDTRAMIDEIRRLSRN